jgi:transcriptional regulator with XRE-family HTH domain
MMQRFGEKLRTLRTRHGLTLRDLAAELGYTNYGHISLIETGKRAPTAELVLKVSLHFGVSADVLLRDDLELDEAK